MPSLRGAVRVECTECRYSIEVTDGDDALPADYVIEHGQETGHTLSVNPEE